MKFALRRRPGRSNLQEKKNTLDKDKYTATHTPNYIPGEHTTMLVPPTQTLPAVHAVQFPSRSWVMYPGPQTQSPGLSEPPPTVCFPVGQAMQLFCPGLAWYFPASHWAHVAVRGAIEKEPGAHPWHGLSPPTPYDPAGQGSHGPSGGPEEPGEQKHPALPVLDSSP